MNQQISLPKFDGKDYAVWKAQFYALMTAKGIESVLDHARPRNTTDPAKLAERKAEQDIYDKNNTAVKAHLLLALDNKHCKLVLQCETSYDMWMRLSAIHEQRSSASKIVLQKEFFDLNLNIDEKVQDYVGRAEYVYGQLRDVGVKSIDESTLVSKIVSGLPRKYINFISSWTTVDGSKQTLDNLLPKLMAEEALLNKFSKKPESLALVGESSKPKKNFMNSKKTSQDKRYQNRNKQNNDDRTKERDTNDNKCFICKKEGHWKKDCRYNKKKSKEEDDKAKNVAQKEPEAVAIVAETNLSSSNNNWILDTGATEHMSNDKSSMRNYKELNPPRVVRFGGQSFGQGLGFGDVEVLTQLKDKLTRKVILKDVLYVPEIRRKLISVSAATANGCGGKITENSITIIDKSGSVILFAEKQNKLYHATLKELPCESSLAEKTLEDDLMLWHNRLAHNNKLNLVKMSRNKSVTGMPDLSRAMSIARSSMRVIDCVSCKLGKQARLNFPSRSKPRAKMIGERVHVDMCGPINCADDKLPMSGAKHFVLFKDEYSNYRFIYFIAKKSGLFDALKKTVAQLESKGCKIRTLVSDRGSELTSNETQKFLLDRSICHEVSAPFTPQQNGFIERDNRTVGEATRSMLFHMKLPEILWDEAANTAIYILNRICNKNTGDTTPYELYFGEKPRVDHIRVFGALALAKLQEKKRSDYQRKLEPRALKTLLVGYDKDFTYRLFDPVDKKIIITRDVSFDESKTLKLTDGKETYKSLETYIDSIPVVSGEDNEDDTEELADDEQVLEESFRSANEEELFEEEDPPEIPVRTSSLPSNLIEGEDTVASFAEALIIYGDEPLSYEQAKTCSYSKQWEQAMREEIDSLIKNNTWSLVKLPEGRKVITCKWVYKLKRKTDGTIERFKARLVARGYSQKAGLDYKETYSPVVKYECIRLILSIVTSEDMEMVHFDIKTAFLHGNLEEEIYMQQPTGFEKGNELVCKLNKSLYGLKQASRAWNKCFSEVLEAYGLEQLNKDNCIFVKRDKSKKAILIIALYVDDGLVCSNQTQLLQEVLIHLKTKFEITIMNPTCFVGLQIKRDRLKRTMHVSQSYYIEKLIKRFGLDETKGAPTPMEQGKVYCRAGVNDGMDGTDVDVPFREAIGSLLFASNATRPDISFAVSKLASYSDCVKKSHWEGVKRIIKYLKQTIEMGLYYQADDNKFSCFADADYAADVDTRKSTSGVLLLMNKAPIVWKSKKQTTIATSTTNAEFIAASVACAEVIWVQQILEELGRKFELPTQLFVDNQSAIKLINNNQVHTKIKHIDIKYMFIRELSERGKVQVIYRETKEQLADILTKQVNKTQFETLIVKMGLKIPKAIKISKKSLVFGLLLCLIQGADGDHDDLQSITLVYDDPCETILKSGGFKYNPRCSHMEIPLFDNCEYNFKHYWVEMVRTITTCGNGSRSKRSIIRKAVKSIGIGATNFILTKFLNEEEIIDDETAERMISQIKNETNSKFESISSAQDILIKEVQNVSSSASHHLQEIKDVSSGMPRLLVAAMKIHSKVLAAAASYKTILKYCIKGQLATEEVSELTGDLELLKLDPENTVIRGIDVDKGKNSITFVFKVKESVVETFWERHFDMIAIYGLAIVYTMSLTFWVVWKFKEEKEAETELQETNHTAEESNNLNIEIRNPQEEEREGNYDVSN